MLAVILGWVLWHSSVSLTPGTETWSAPQRVERAESVGACDVERARRLADLRRQHPEAQAMTSPAGVVVRDGDRATVHLYYCLPASTRLD